MYNLIVNKNTLYFERMINMYNHIAILKQARIQAGLTQAQVAKETGYTVAHVNRFENGARQSFHLFIFYVTYILNDIQKELLIENLIFTLTCTEDKNLYELSVLSAIDYIKGTMKYEH